MRKSKKHLAVSNRSDSVSENKEGRAARFFYAALCFLLALTLFFPGEQPERTGSAHLPCLLWLLIYIAWFAKFQRKTPSSGADKIVFSFFVWVGFSAVFSLFDGGGYRPVFNTLSVWFTFAAAYFLFRESLHSARTIRTVFGVITAVMFAQALTGIEQYFVSIPAMQRQFEANPELAVSAADPTLAPGSADWEHFVSRIETARPMGTYPLSNSLGGLLACALFIAGMCGGKQKSRSKTVVMYLLIAVMGFAFLLTRCRSGMVAVCFGVVLWTIFDLRRRWKFESDAENFTAKRHRFVIRFIAGTLLAFAVLTALMFLPGKGLAEGAKRSLGFRLEYWQASSGMLREHCLFGCGSGNFKQSYTQYKLPHSSEEIGDPHNFAVEIATESGLPALFLFLLLLGILCRPFFLAEKKNEEDNPLPLDPSENTELFCYGGGCLGCWAAFLFSFGLEAAMSPVAPLAATFAFPFCAWLYNTQENRSIPSSFVFIALAVLLVHLSAAGGFSVTSTSILLWLFIAVIFNLASNRHTEPPNILAPASKWIFGKLFLGVIGVCFVYFLGLRPVSNAHSLMTKLGEPTNVSTRSELLRRISDADPWSAVLREQQADDVFRRWVDNPLNERWETEAVQITQDAVSLLPRSAGLHFRFAQRYTTVFEKTGKESHRQNALNFYRKANELYPNNAGFRAAWALFLGKTTKNDEESREASLQRNEALRLDELMPHTEQKLPQEIRNQLAAF